MSPRSAKGWNVCRNANPASPSRTRYRTSPPLSASRIESAHRWHEERAEIRRGEVAEVEFVADLDLPAPSSERLGERDRPDDRLAAAWRDSGGY
ncbi:MAG: hypothetical protein R3F11_21630 [Verrucomicrobiales bacterium]